jgi:tetrahydromethanopterin S-methyltransferase subunit G
MSSNDYGLVTGKLEDRQLGLLYSFLTIGLLLLCLPSLLIVVATDIIYML